MNQLSEQVLLRLLLAKSLLDRTRTHTVAEPDSFFVAQQLLSAHDAAELAIAAVADHCGASPNERYLMQYITALEKKTVRTVEGKGYLSQLNQARIGFKHYGNLPDPRQWLRVTDKVYEVIEKWCADFLNISLDALDQSALLQLEEVRNLYAEAKKSTHAEKYEECLVTLAKALHIVFRHNSALRGLQAGVARPEDAIKLAGFGVHGNDYLALQEFLPTIREDRDTHELRPYWNQVEFGHPGNWRRDTVEFCLRAFLDTALKIQNAEWIPGAIGFKHFYEYKVTALQLVNVWRTRPAQNETPDVLFSLKPGESTFASGVFKHEANNTPTLASLLTYPLAGFGPQKTYDAHLEIYFSEAELITAHKAGVGYVKLEGVTVTCVPRQTEFVTKYFPDLPEIDWQEKFR